MMKVNVGSEVTQVAKSYFPLQGENYTEFVRVPALIIVIGNS